MNKLNALVVAAAALLAPLAANAQTAYTASAVELRAGPARDYPVVAILGSRLAVNVQGCLHDFSWCDVIVGPNRGWLHGRELVFDYQGAQVPIVDYGAALGIGLVSFVIGTYWQDHYVSRPWYPRMPHWAQRPARPQAHPRQGLIHPGATPHRILPQRPLQRAPTTGISPRPPHTGARLTVGSHPGPAPRPLLRPAGPGFDRSALPSHARGGERRAAHPPAPTSRRWR